MLERSSQPLKTSSSMCQKPLPASMAALQRASASLLPSRGSHFTGASQGLGSQRCSTQASASTRRTS
eukprot:5582210-Lingulodinium_polyedra.AAC.1